MKPGQFRFLLAMIVLLHHSTPLRLGNWAVFVFFILSGYWIARLWDQKYGSFERPRLVFLASRWWRLFPVFLVCSLLSLAVIRLLPHATELPRDLPQWLWRQVPIAGSSSLWRPLGPTWSLDVEMQFYLLAAVVLAWLPRLNHRMLAVAMAGFAALGVLFVGLGGSLLEPCLPLWLGYFLAGVLIYRTDYQPGRTAAMVSVGAILLDLLFAAVVPALRSAVWSSELSGETFGLSHGAWGAMLTCGNAFLMIPFVAYNVRQPSCELDRGLGNWAYPLYLFHWIPRLVYYQVIDASGPWYGRLPWLAANFAAALLGSYLILRAVDQPLEKARGRWLARWVGKNPHPAANVLKALSFPREERVLSK